MATFAIVRDTLSPTLRRLTRRLGSPADRARFTMRWGTRIRKIAIENAIAKGGRKFWRAVARSINLERKGDEVTVGAHHVAAAQKQYGGSIKAKGKAAGGANALTIPIADEAEGQTAAKFMAAGKKLFAISKTLGGDRGVLGYSEGGEFKPLFALRRETKDIPADPFFPKPDEIISVGIEEAELLLKA